jgi:3-hydroxyacyl-[acyl-carrier-protein] dehydratase
MQSSVLNNLPHRKPFRFVTSILELEVGRRGVGLWHIVGDEDFFAGHFPGNPLVPGVLLAEALAQVSGIVAFASDDGVRPDHSGWPAGEGHLGPARLAQVSVKFQAGVVPPADVRLESVLTREMSGLFLFDVRADVGSVVAASGTLVLARSFDRSGAHGAAL